MRNFRFLIDNKYLKKVSYGFICFAVFIVGISTLNFNVLAKEKNEYTEDGISYTVNNNSVVIIGGDKDAKTLDIKDKYKSKKVVEIADSAFKDYTNLETIYMPEKIKTIGDYAFANCTSLKDVDINEKVKTIGSHAFENCESLENVYMNGKPKIIGDYAFANCKSLESIDINKKINKIGLHAFENCTSMKNVFMFGSPKEIGDYAFYNCKKLKSIDIDKKVKTVGSHAFDGCLKLKDVFYVSKKTNYSIDAFENCPKLKNAPKGKKVINVDPIDVESKANSNGDTETQKMESKEADNTYYSTNDYENAKKGNVGKFAYVHEYKSYNIYFLIDFDEGYVYKIIDGDGGNSADRLKIESGDLNTSLLYRYHDGDSEWSEILHFNYENNPSTLIYVDNSGTKNKYRATSFEKVQDLLNTKQVVDY